MFGKRIARWKNHVCISIFKWERVKRERVEDRRGDGARTEQLSDAGWRSCAVLVCSSLAVIWWPHSSYNTLSALVSSAELMCCVPATNQLPPPTWLFLESPPLLQLVECIILIPLKRYSFPNKNAHEGIVASSNLDIIPDDWRHNLLSSVIFACMAYTPVGCFLWLGGCYCYVNCNVHSKTPWQRLIFIWELLSLSWRLSEKKDSPWLEQKETISGRKGRINASALGDWNI